MAGNTRIGGSFPESRCLCKMGASLDMDAWAIGARVRHPHNKRESQLSPHYTASGVCGDAGVNKSIALAVTEKHSTYSASRRLYHLGLCKALYDVHTTTSSPNDTFLRAYSPG